MPKRIITNEKLFPPSPLSLREVRSHLLPGKGHSELRHGYLGEDEDLDRLIEADAKILEEQGLTHDQVARAIEELFACESNEEFRGTPIFPLEYIHSPPCPWKDFAAVSPFDLTLKVTEIVVVNRAKVDEFFRMLNEKGELNFDDYPDLVREDLAMIFSDLHPHLIREHRFFEGFATPYRIDPTKVAQYLEMR